MYKVLVCKGCGRTIDSHFLYCPWCGNSRVSREQDSLDILLNKFEEMHKDVRRKQLAEMNQELRDLEDELSVLSLSAEMHK